MESVLQSARPEIRATYSWKLFTAHAVTALALFHRSTEICVGTVLLRGNS